MGRGRGVRGMVAVAKIQASEAGTAWCADPEGREEQRLESVTVYEISDRSSDAWRLGGTSWTLPHPGQLQSCTAERKQPWSAVVRSVVHGRRCGRVNQEDLQVPGPPFSANFLPFPALLFPRRQFEEERARGRGGRRAGARIAYVTARWECACVSAHARRTVMSPTCHCWQALLVTAWIFSCCIFLLFLQLQGTGNPCGRMCAGPSRARKGFERR